MSVNEKMASSTELWEAWLASSLGQLRSAGLLRTLRPVLPTLSAIQVHNIDGVIEVVDVVKQILKTGCTFKRCLYW